MPILDIRNISITFGGLTAVRDFSLQLEEEELVAIIGPNGAGKTTVFNMLSGLYKPDSGEIILDDKNVAGYKPYQLNQMGIARTFQNIRLFGDATVIDNLKIAMNSSINYTLRDSLFRTKKYLQEEKKIDEEAVQMLDILGLSEKVDHKAKNLSYGEQRRLEISRALITHPKILLLDEPCAGMNSTEIVDMMALIKKIREQFRIATIFIEHHMSIVMSIAHRIQVLDFGEIIAMGTPKEIQHNPQVIQAYLGKGYVNAQNS